MSTRRVLVSCLLLAASMVTGTSPAFAGTLNMRWNACWGDGGVANRNFACDTNSGNQSLLGSFFLPHDVIQPTGNEIVVDLATAGASLSPWWDFKNAGACRQTSLAMNFVPPATSVQCVDWASGQAVGGIAAYAPLFVGSSAMRIRAAAAIPLAGTTPLFAGQEYYSFTLTILNLKTVGTNACTGCSVGVCLNFRSLKVTTPSAITDVTINPGPGPGPGDQGYLDALTTFQGGTGVISIRSPGGPTNCYAATPTRGSTWGEVKALYR